jgi:23S rRNA (cytosine1962-C5)-methyltransferase
MIEQPSQSPTLLSPSGLCQIPIVPRAVQRLKAGLPLVLRSDVTSEPPDDTELVLLCDLRGQPVATALWVASGPLAARMWSMQGEGFGEVTLARRLAAALERRRPLLASGERDAFRVVHGEADLLPGLFVDYYADAVVIQTATRAMDRRKPLLADLLAQLLPIDRVVVRDDGSARDMESLPREKGFLRGGPLRRARFHDAGSTMEADLLSDRKTGSFLDQQDNHAEVASWAQSLCPGGQALDTFTYHGGFALAMARAGLGVIACDEDPLAIARARHNAELSGVAVDFHIHNAFDLLRSYEAEGRRFDVVVLDPPALAKRGRTAALGQHAMTQAMRAYKELNLRALRILRPGGLLATCSCSGRVTVEDFATMLRSAAQDAGRPLQLLWRRGAGIDHPVLWGLPESEYLKCWLFRVLA